MDDESEEQRDKRILSLWSKLDVRRQGSLDVSALKLGLKKLDHPLQNADELITDVLQAADINHDGLVQFEGQPVACSEVLSGTDTRPRIPEICL